MALVPASLAKELDSAYQSYGSIASMADSYATAIINFWNTGQTSFGNVAIADAGFSILKSDIKSALEAYSSGTVVATEIASAIDKAGKLILTTGPANHISTSPLGFSALISGLIKAYNSYDEGTEIHANEIADTINNYTTAILITGIIPGSPPVPVQGNLQ